MEKPITEYLKSGDSMVKGKILRTSIIIKTKKIITKYFARNTVKSDILDSFNRFTTPVSTKRKRNKFISSSRLNRSPNYCCKKY